MYCMKPAMSRVILIRLKCPEKLLYANGYNDGFKESCSLTNASSNRKDGMSKNLKILSLCRVVFKVTL